MIAKTAAIFKKYGVEASVVVWQGRMIVLYVSRLPAEEHDLIICDYLTGEVIAKTPTQGLALGCALVVGAVLHYWATDGVGTSGNSIKHTSTRDLVHWTTVTTAWTAAHPEQKIFNTSVCFDGTSFYMAYETSEPYYGNVDFNIRFFKSSTPTGGWVPYGPIYGSERYVACPRIDYSAGYYYMHFLVAEDGQWKTRVARSIDIAGPWIQSEKFAIAPSLPDELINTSDIDFIEFDGNVYFVYCAGDQGTTASNAMDLKQAFAYGTLAQYLASFF